MERLLWLDWMKVLAIIAIVWGHFFSDGHLYLYVFSVQVFCIISGFLYHRADSWRECLGKCFWGLIVPTVIMSIIMHLDAWIRCAAMGKEYPVSLVWYVKWLLLGHRWCMGPCWYFYSLVVMRIIMQILPQRTWARALLLLTTAAGAVAWNKSGIGTGVSNANVNVLVTMPLFVIGVFLQPLKTRLSAMHNRVFEVVLLAMAVVAVVVCGNTNGYVWMYLCAYGNNFLLYVVGAFAGTAMLYVMALWLSRVGGKMIATTLSKGSILIIGLHVIIVRRLTELPDRMWLEDLFASVFILLGFIPIIQLAERYCPLLLGKKHPPVSGL